MTKFITTLTTILCCLGISNGMAQAPKVIQDGIFTEAQAERGAEAYSARCASCHAADLRGASNAPGLVGVGFMFLWEGRSVGELYTKIRTEMPSDQPGSLPAQTYADILGFILRTNQFPAGSQELVAGADWLNSILISPAP